MEAVVFYIFAAIMMGSSLAVALSKNIIRSAMWLLGTLGSAAMLYFLMAANLVAAIQLIVYAGGILILIVFGVMLTARNPHMKSVPKRAEVLVAALVAIALFVGIVSISTFGDWPDIPGGPVKGDPVRAASVETIGNKLLTEYLLPFELASVLLLAVMIGAAYLARPEKK